MPSKVSSLLAARGEWDGEPLASEETQELVDFLEERILDVKAGKVRGLLFAAVDAGGPGSEFYTTVKLQTGCSRLALSGAAHLLAYKAAKYIEDE